MTTDPMLAKAEALEEELLHIAKFMGGWPSSPTLLSARAADPADAG